MRSSVKRFTKDEIQKAIQIFDYVKDGVTHGMVRAYLEKNGWQLSNTRKGAEWWDNGDTTVMLPLDESFADYRLRMQEVISDIAADEGLHPMVIKLQILLACS